MTKEEQLKIYSAYFPYKLEMQHIDTDWAEDREMTVILTGVFEDCLTFNQASDYYYNDDQIVIKPVLYPLEYLTKEIEHDGKMITPIVELAKIGTGEKECGVTNGNLGTCYVNAKNEKKGFFIYHPKGYFIWQVGKNAEPLIVKNQLELFQKLLEWHFNIFQLPESDYINKSILTNK